MSETPSHFSEFDAQAAGQALGAEPHRTHDIAHGDGEALNVGDTTLEVYPEAGFARVTTADARIELYRVPSYTVTGERVVFEQGDQDDRTRLLVRNDGKVSFYPVLRAAETSRAPDRATSGRQDSPAGQVSSETATGRTSNTEGDKAGEVEQVLLQGRLGRDPWFSTSGEQQVGGFPPAVNNSEGQTTWHKVVVFDDTARQLYEDHDKGYVRKGRLVDVTGQTVIREEPTARGGVKKSPEFHATAVTRVQSTRQRPGR